MTRTESATKACSEGRTAAAAADTASFQRVLDWPLAPLEIGVPLTMNSAITVDYSIICSKLNPSLGANAGLEWMLYLSHFGDEVSGVDQFLWRVAAP